MFEPLPEERRGGQILWSAEATVLRRGSRLHQGWSARRQECSRELPASQRHMGDTVNAVDLPELLVADAGEWRIWLSAHHADSQGVWLVLAKKGTADPTSLSYDEALDEAICFGWIDGQLVS